MIPMKYQHVYLPTKLFLISYRAWSDADRAVRLLQNELSAEDKLLSDWKIHWIAACVLLRSSIDLFRRDSKLCISPELRDAVKSEWNAIKTDKQSNRIFWDFLREERNNIVHEYRWSAYEYWLNDEGEKVHPTLLTQLNYHRSVEIREGPYKGKPSMEVLELASDWAEDRIMSAIARSGLDPNEKRSASTFVPMPKGPTTLIG